jgi:hypothetical protein
MPFVPHVPSFKCSFWGDKCRRNLLSSHNALAVELILIKWYVGGFSSPACVCTHLSTKFVRVHKKLVLSFECLEAVTSKGSGSLPSWDHGPVDSFFL